MSAFTGNSNDIPLAICMIVYLGIPALTEVQDIND